MSSSPSSRPLIPAPGDDNQAEEHVHQQLESLRLDSQEPLSDKDVATTRLQTNAQRENVLYTPLANPNDFRLIYVNRERSGIAQGSYTFRMVRANPSGNRPYKALSYTWDSPFFNREEELISFQNTIIINDTVFPVRQNLYDFLEELVNRSYDGYIWIDAICINQHDIAERNAQVLLMGEIYASASEVTIWLGKDMAYLSDVQSILNRKALIAKAVELLNQLNMTAIQSLLFPINERTETARDLLAQWKGFWRFFECRTWFTRVWIIQEAALAKGISIWCGKEGVDWKDLDLLLKVLSASGTMGLFARWTDKTNGEGSPNRMFRLGMHRETCQLGLEDVSFMDAADPRDGRQRSEAETNALRFHHFACNLLNLARTHHATDPRDKIYSFIGLLERFRPPGVTPLIRPNYEDSISTEHVYTVFTFALIQRLPSLIVLSSIEDKEDRKLQNLPSWVPDYTVSSEQFTALSALTNNCNFNPAGYTKPPKPPLLTNLGSTWSLTLYGYPIDSISATSLSGDTGKAAIFEWENPTWFEYLRSVITLADPELLSPHYNAPALNTLCRPLISSVVKGEPATAAIDRSFYNWLIYMIGRPGSLEQCAGTPGSTKWTAFSETIRAVAKLTQPNITLSGVLYTSYSGLAEEIYQFIQVLYDGGLEAQMAIATLNREMAEFNMAYAMPGNQRRLFRTDMGLLGLGLRSVKEGDVVWVIEGATMCVVLRPKTEEDGTVKMEFVGDAYVHGCMNGEIFGALEIDKRVREVHIE